jgi:hypothetical protein
MLSLRARIHLGGQVPQLPQGLDDTSLFQQQLASVVKLHFLRKFRKTDGG